MQWCGDSYLTVSCFSSTIPPTDPLQVPAHSPHLYRGWMYKGSLYACADATDLALALHSNQCMSLVKSRRFLALSLLICKVKKVNRVDSKRSFFVLSLMRW